jgi:hypothetical protein
LQRQSAAVFELRQPRRLVGCLSAKTADAILIISGMSFRGACLGRVFIDLLAEGEKSAVAEGC